MAGNSWQQPVGGQPSWGTFHTHISTVFSSASLATTTLTSITLTSLPIGITGVRGVAKTYRAAGMKDELSLLDMARNVWTKNIQMAATTSAWANFQVPVDSNRQFLFWGSNASIRATITILGYYL